MTAGGTPTGGLLAGEVPEEPPHPSAAQLQRWLDGELDDAAAERIEAHVGQCADCRSTLHNLRTTDLGPGGLGAVALRGSDAGRSGALRQPQSPPPGAPACPPGYSYVRPLGRGGMGSVFLARDERLARDVAIKVVDPPAEYAGRADPRFLARFRLEAEAMARLHHPNIVPVHAFGEQDGRPYLVMEYADGGRLDEAAGPAARDRRLDPRQAAGLVETLARAAAYAHGRGVIHRDLKPSNILLAAATAGGQAGSADGAREAKADDERPGAVRLGDRTVVPMLADFGLVKLISDADGAGGDPAARLAQTLTGEVWGSPGFMAPEQARGEVDAIGTWTDVHALGAILYYLLVGRSPFDAPTRDGVIERVKADPAEPVREHRPDVPADLETVCLKCLHKAPADRYASAADLADDLVRFRRGEPIRARKFGPAERAWRWARRNPAVAGSLAAVLLSLVAGLTVSLVVLGREREARVAADVARQGEAAQRGVAEQQRAAAEQQRGIAEQNQKRAEQNQVLAEQNAERAKAEAERVKLSNAFFRQMIDQTHFGAWGAGPDVKVRDMLDVTSDQLKRGLGPDRPDILAATHQIVGEAYQGLRLLKPAREHLAKAVEVRRRAAATQPAGRDGASDDETELAASILALAGVVNNEDQKQAESLMAEAVAMYERLGTDPRSLAGATLSLGRIRGWLGKAEEAERLLDRAAGMRGALPEADRPSFAAACYQAKAEVARRKKDLPAARRHLTEALATLAEYPPDAAGRPGITMYSDLADVCRALKDYPAAADAYWHALVITERLYGADSLQACQIHVALADVAGGRGDLRGAADAYFRAVPGARKSPPHRDREAAAILAAAGTLAIRTRDDWAGGLPLIVEAYELVGTRYPDDARMPKLDVSVGAWRRNTLAFIVAGYERLGDPSKAAEWRARGQREFPPK